MEFTQAQQAAIDDRNHSLIVSAGAGSGKTAVMIERIVSLVLEGRAHLSDFAAITFTRAAAGEIRRRLSGRFEELAQKENTLAAEELNNLDDAYIGTIHGFCSSIIRANHDIADVDPGFMQADPGRMKAICMETAQALCEEYYDRQEPAFLEFARCRDDLRNEALPKLIISTYEYFMNLPDPLEALRAFAQAYRQNDEEMLSSAWCDALEKQALLKLKVCLGGYDYLFGLASQSKLPDYSEVLRVEQDYLFELEQYVRTRAYRMGKPVPAAPSTRLPPAKAAVHDTAAADAFKEARTKIRSSLTSLLKSPVFTGFAHLNENTRAAAEAAGLLCGLVCEYHTRLEAEKRAMNLLDYNDLEQKALLVLRDEGARASVRRRYPFVMVDEFQDTNNVQVAIMQRLETEGGFFCVGDVKQSIYRFRGAEPKLFLQKLEEAEFEPVNGLKKIYLNRNFRSTPGVISFINELFYVLMDRQTMEIQYDENETLYPGIEAELTRDAGLLIIDEDDSAPIEDSSALTDLKRIEKEAAAAAGEIRTMLGQIIYDAKKKCYRPITPGDVAILLRSRRSREEGSRVAYYMDALRRTGMKVTSPVGENLIDTPECLILLDLLQLVDNSMLDECLIRVMVSPIGGFTPDELAHIRAEFRNCAYHQAAEQFAQLPGELSIKVKEFLASLARWRSLTFVMDVESFLDTLLRESGFEEICAVYEDGETRQANLRAAVRLAAGYEKGFSAFVALFETLLENTPVTPREGARDSVTIMTIHASKGLEFPVVLLCDAGRGFNITGWAEVLLSKDLGMGLVHRDSRTKRRAGTLPHAAITAENSARECVEELRLLYVALTRARNKLLITATTPNLEKCCTHLQIQGLSAGKQNAGSFLEWLLIVLMEKVSSQGMSYPHWLQRAGEALGCDVQVIPSNQVQKVYFDTHSEQKEVLPDKTVFSLPTPTLDALEEAAQAEKSLERLPSKISVTSLLDAQRDFRKPLPAPPPQENPLHAETRLTAMERGTVIHAILQHLPLRMISPEELKALAQTLVTRGILTEEEKEAADYEAVLRFIRSPLYARICASPRVLKEQTFVLKAPACELLTNERSTQPLLVQGMIDLCFMEEGRWVLVDYKTNRVTACITKEDIFAHYVPQLKVYKRALEEITGIEVAQVHLYLIAIGEAVSCSGAEL